MKFLKRTLILILIFSILVSCEMIPSESTPNIEGSTTNSTTITTRPTTSTSSTTATKPNDNPITFDPDADACYFENFDEIVDYVLANAKEGDLVLTMGAGDIYKVGEMIMEKAQ